MVSLAAVDRLVATQVPARLLVPGRRVCAASKCVSSPYAEDWAARHRSARSRFARSAGLDLRFLGELLLDDALALASGSNIARRRLGTLLPRFNASTLDRPTVGHVLRVLRRIIRVRLPAPRRAAEQR